MDEMDLSQFKEVFISEAKEHLVVLNAALVELEKTPSDKEVLNKIFRVAHTLKGMSATMGYDKITKLTHSMEDILDKLRRDNIQAKGSIVDVIFECFDKLDALVEEIETGVESEINIENLLKHLENLINQEDTQDFKQDELNTMSLSDDMEDVKTSDVDNVQQADTNSGVATAVSIKKSKTSIRINISHLDTMMNLVGEMVISKSQLEQIADEYKIDALKENLRQLDRVAVELQEAVLKTRMVPLSQIFDRFPRMVRDLSIKLGKDINFEIYGADIEIDRMLLEEINEPLIHLLRNAVDHGIEEPEKRVLTNKGSKARITLNARRERGYISIEVADDGKGLDPQYLRQKAIEKNIITEEIAKTISDEDTYMLICNPRFSTAETITDISGRGVGMDVVKTAIESFNGSLLIKSIKGAGSSFIITLPLSIAIISALLVKVLDEIYAIPLNNISEVVHFEVLDVKSIESKEVIMLRDEVLPIIWLEKIFGTSKLKKDDQSIKNNKKNKFILRVEIGNKSAGLVVDDFIGRKDIVIKSLTGLVKRSKGFSGATILGDGSVVLIMDVASWI